MDFAWGSVLFFEDRPRLGGRKDGAMLMRRRGGGHWAVAGLAAGGWLFVEPTEKHLAEPDIPATPPRSRLVADATHQPGTVVSGTSIDMTTLDAEALLRRAGKWPRR